MRSGTTPYPPPMTLDALLARTLRDHSISAADDLANDGSACGLTTALLTVWDGKRAAAEEGGPANLKHSRKTSQRFSSIAKATYAPPVKVTIDLYGLTDHDRKATPTAPQCDASFCGRRADRCVPCLQRRNAHCRAAVHTS